MPKARRSLAALLALTAIGAAAAQESAPGNPDLVIHAGPLVDGVSHTAQGREGGSHGGGSVR